MNNQRRIIGILATVALGGVTGCPSPNIYGTARTTPKGELSHTVSLDSYGVSEAEIKDEENSTSASGVIILPPSYTLHYGATDNIEVGFRVANMSSIGADGKFNFLKGNTLDLAVDPGFQWFRATTSSSTSDGSSESTTYNTVFAHLPLLMDLNLGESFSLVATTGIMYGLLIGADSSDLSFLGYGLSGRLGLGFNVRFSKKFAIQPEVTVFKSFEEDGTIMYSAGLGFNFGHLPQFGASSSVSDGEKL